MAEPKIKRILKVIHQDRGQYLFTDFHTVLFEIEGAPSKHKALMIATLFNDLNKCYVIYNVSELKKIKEPKAWVNDRLHWELRAAVKIMKSAQGEQG